MKFPIKDFFSKCDQIRRKLEKDPCGMPSTNSLCKLYVEPRTYFHPLFT